MATDARLPEHVPAPPPDAMVTAWDPGLPPGVMGMPPRLAAVLLLNESYLRCRLLGDRLREQVETDRARSASPHGGLVGYKTARAGDGTIYPTGEEVRGLVRVELDERRFCLQLLKTAHDLGITEDDWR
jgi:hypothetical protein